MEDVRPATTGDGALVIWQARPTARRVVGELAVSLVVGALLVGLDHLVSRSDPWFGWIGLAPPVVSAVRSIVTAVRGRVVLSPDGIEVRQVLTRHYPWESLLSITVEDDGRIEITPKGWVRKLPIPQDQVAEAFSIITAWRAAALARP